MNKEKLRKRIQYSVIVLTGITAIFIFIYSVIKVIDNNIWVTNLLNNHFICIAGIPWAAITSFILISIFESISGEIKMSFGPVKFEGASSPLIIWSFLFITIVIGIKLLYN